MEKKEKVYQVHFQNKKTGETIFLFQFKSENEKGIQKAVDKSWEQYPPPKGYQFLICTENSRYFEKGKETENV